MQNPAVLDHRSLLNGHKSHALIVLNNIGLISGPSSDNTLLIRLWRTASFIVIADGAANLTAKLLEHDIPTPNVVCGDFDSIDEATLRQYRNKGASVVHFDSQDYTDLHKSILVVACHHMGVDFQKQHDILSLELDNKELQLDVVVFGAFGGRFDHEMSAIHELYRSQYWFRSMTLLSHSNLACLVRPGITTIKCNMNLQRLSSCGLIPLQSPVQLISTQGLKWNLSKNRLELGNLISTSNCIVADTVTIECSDSVVWTTSLHSLLS